MKTTIAALILALSPAAAMAESKHEMAMGALPAITSQPERSKQS
nr:hypothetical protein [Seohaeicola saemankumensis]